MNASRRWRRSEVRRYAGAHQHEHPRQTGRRRRSSWRRRGPRPGRMATTTRRPAEPGRSGQKAPKSGVHPRRRRRGAGAGARERRVGHAAGRRGAGGTGGGAEQSRGPPRAGATGSGAGRGGSSRSRAPAGRRASGGSVKRRVPPWSCGHPAGDGQSEPGARRRWRRCRSAGRRARGRRRRRRGHGRRPRATSRSAYARRRPGPVSRRALWRAALSSDVDEQLPEPGRVGLRRRGRAAIATSNAAVRPACGDLADAVADEVGHGRRRGARRRVTPASSRDRSSRSVTRSRSRSACARAPARCSRVGGTTPSARFSRTAIMAASGVRSSWETVAIRSRRSASTCARSAAIWLKTAASRPTSSVDVRAHPAGVVAARHPLGHLGHLTAAGPPCRRRAAGSPRGPAATATGSVSQAPARRRPSRGSRAAAATTTRDGDERTELDLDAGRRRRGSGPHAGDLEGVADPVHGADPAGAELLRAAP